MLFYGIPRRKGRYDGLKDTDPVSIEPDSKAEIVLWTMFYIVALPVLTVAHWVYKYWDECRSTAITHIKRRNYQEWVNRKH